MQIFEVLNSQETRQRYGNAVGNFFSPQATLLIVDDDSRTIFIFHGEKSRLVLLFIAKRLAKDLRTFMRGFYTIQDLLDADAIASIASSPITENGKIPAIIRENSPYSVLDANNEEITDVSPNAEDISPVDPDWRERLELSQLPIFELPKVSDVLTTIKGAPAIPEYEINMLLIGNSVYTPTTVLTRFLKHRQFEEKFEKLGQLPEGQFFSPGYSCRLNIKKGRLESLEFLTSKNSPIQDGKINAPVLYINRIMVDRSPDLLSHSFQIPPDDTVEELIEKAKISKSSS